MRTVHTYVLHPHLPALGGVSAQSAHTHTDDILMQIGHSKIATEQITEQEIGVGGYFVGLILQSPFGNSLTADIARRMQRQPSVTHFPQTVVTANPVTHDLVSVARSDKQTVAIQKICPGLTHPFYNMADSVRRIQKIV